MSRGYDRLAWVDYPETLTPISAANLNRMENGIANLYTDRNKLESNMAYVEDGDTSSRHYDIDAYLMHNGVFYKVTEEINIGDTLDYGPDGNIAHVDISSQFASGGVAGEVAYDNTHSGLTAGNVQDAIDELNSKSSGGVAGDVTYDNTQSGLAADNVQDALDEVTTNKAGLTTGGPAQASDQIYSKSNGECALQAVKGANATRLQLDPDDGDVSVYKTTDSGTTWTRLQHIGIKKAKVYDANISVSTASTDVTFSFPADFHSSLGIILGDSWPMETWDPTACVSIRRDFTVHGNQAKVTLSSTKTQRYMIALYLIYI